MSPQGKETQLRGRSFTPPNSWIRNRILGMILDKPALSFLGPDIRFQLPRGHSEDLRELGIDGRGRVGAGFLAELGVEAPEVDFDGRGRAGGESEVEEAGVDGAEAGGGDCGALLDDPGDRVGVLEEAPDSGAGDSGVLGEFDEGRGLGGEKDLGNPLDRFGGGVVGR
jgi:hypothetical protein